MSKLIDLTGQIIGNWEVLERGPNTKSGGARWLCKCRLCNKTVKLVTSHNLRSGQSYSCGCQKMEKMRQACIKDETGKVYGYLKVLRQATQEEKKQKITGKTTNGVYWVCECLKCGNPYFIVKGDYLRNGDTKSCGCINSINEAKISDLLKTLNLSFKQQYSFQDLFSTGRNCDKLLFDFAIFDKNNNNLLYLIEYDGEQHFLQSHAWNTEQYYKTVQNDNLKNTYCFEHKIPLIRIPYYKKYTIEDLKLETTNFLLNPKNIDIYYKIRE